MSKQKKSKKKLLLISYTFPPNNAIGGRRWGKFAKELFRLNYDVKVLTFNNKNKHPFSNWSEDIASLKNHISYVPDNYPQWLDSPKSSIDKILYRFSLLYVKLKAKGNYYDRASFLRAQTLKQTEFFIQQGYTNVIVTCAPFKLALWVSELIPKYPQVNFIVDFRDPWTNNFTSYGLNSMSEKRIRTENEAERRVINRFHKIIVVAQEMKDYFINKYRVSNEHFSVISNGFDEDDFREVEDVSRLYFQNNTKIRIVFAGTFYENATYLLQKLADTIRSEKLFLDQFEFHFFGTLPVQATAIVNSLKTCFFYHGQIELKKVYSVISNSDFCALFLTNDINYSLSTKFHEYLSQNKKIIVFSNNGDTGKFVEKNNLGIGIGPDDMHSSLLRVIEMHKNKTNLSSETFLFQDYNVKNLVKKIEILLK